MKTVDFEILIATMNRTDLSFLSSMFKEVHYDAYLILIINQTTKDRLLESPHKNIRVINSFEKGLSKSRNLALKHAIGDVCLIADDDVCFTSDFQQRIIEAYTE
ncbi:MAG: glycosyltransferase, partial [Bacteroidota bacterium]